MQANSYPRGRQGLLIGLVAGLAILAVAGLPSSASAQIGNLPTNIYFGARGEFFDGDYRDALADFLSELQNGSFKVGANRWVDSICYQTMAGECYFQLGMHEQAMAQFTAALQMYLATPDWLLRVQFPPTIMPAGAGSVQIVPWGASKRTFRLGAFPATTLVQFGQLNNNNVVRFGGVVQQAMLTPVAVQEIVRCTAQAMRRRRELLGPLASYDPLANDLIAVLSRRPGQPNHWSECYIDLMLGMALAQAGKDPQAKTALERAMLAGGEYDHPLTAMAMVELARIALTTGDFATAEKYYEEATYTAVNYPDPGLMEEAFRYGLMTHLLANRKGPYPPLIAAANWARVPQGMATGQLEVSLLTLAAENACVLGQAKAGMDLIARARNVVGRNAGNKLVTRLNFVNALAQYQLGHVQNGDTALAVAMSFQQKGSLWGYQINLCDTQRLNKALPLSPRVAMDAYNSLLRDPTPADWLTNPLEALSVLMVPHPLSYEYWFDVALERKEYEKALEVADMARRHRFLNSQELGGRVLNLRWVLEAPAELLDQKATLERQDLKVRFPGYDQLSQQARKLRTELEQMPLVAAKTDEAKLQTAKLNELAQVSALQEAVLREIAVRREPCSLVFPPMRTTKDVQKALPDGHGLLAFFNTSRQTHAFLMTNDKYGYWAIASPTAVERNIKTLLRDFGNWDQNKAVKLADLESTSWKKPAAELFQQLMKDSKADSRMFKELVVVPDSILWYVPFETLQVPDGGTTKSLISLMKLRYAPTVGLGVGDTRPRRLGGNMAVVLGRLYPQDTDEVAEAAFKDFERTVPGAVAIKGKLPGPPGVYASLFDRMTVLSEVFPSEGDAYHWSPLPSDTKTPGNTLGSWLPLPWGGPDQVILPGFRTTAENSLKQNVAGVDLFLSTCGLMASGARTILISRWRPGGQTSYDLAREFAQELPYTTAADAWQRSVQLVSTTTLNPTLEPRVNATGVDTPPKADNPFFWAGLLLVDTGVRPTDNSSPPPDAPIVKEKPAAAGAKQEAAQNNQAPAAQAVPVQADKRPEMP